MAPGEHKENVTPLPTLNILGTRIGILNLESAVGLFARWLRQPGPCRYVCVTGVHGVMEAIRDPEVRRIHNQADACVPDGMPLAWIGRRRGHRSMGRVYGPELMLRMLALAARDGLSCFFCGGAEGVAEELARRMTARFPGLTVAGTFSPPFRPLTTAEEADFTSRVNRLRPDLTWIGLSTPKQERWMFRFHSRLQTRIMFGVGAAFDFHTGRVRQAPGWVQNAGMEWLFRLCMEPRRLSGRYLRNNPAFLWHLALQRLGLREYPEA
jgi:N-acetylglucosaminyldiphosphoundecaprenol N-acetyl-beta-D-mannosaminyltransferase